MMNSLKKTLIIISTGFFILSLAKPAFTQEEQLQEKKRFFLFQKFHELDERKKERDTLKQRHKEEKRTLKENYELEMKSLREKQKQFKQQKAEQEEKKESEEKAKKEENKAQKLEIENKLEEQEQYIERISEAKRSVTILTNEEDPILIVNADVQDAKTAFLKMNEVEFKYKLKLKNQTPKIINRFSFTWQRKLPFEESLNFKKETKVSKPLIPYEDRVVEYNELNYQREGEIYLVKVDQVVFQDGTQWINPTEF